MAAITTSQPIVLPETRSADESRERVASSSALRGILLAVPMGTGIWVLLISLVRLLIF